jgi:hypothetical protein
MELADAYKMLSIANNKYNAWELVPCGNGNKCWSRTPTLEKRILWAIQLVAIAQVAHKFAHQAKQAKHIRRRTLTWTWPMW